MQEKSAHLRGKKFLPMCQNDGGKEKAGEQGQCNGIVHTRRIRKRGAIKTGLPFLHRLIFGQPQRICRNKPVAIEQRQRVRHSFSHIAANLRMETSQSEVLYSKIGRASCRERV